MQTKFPATLLLTGLLICILFALMIYHMQCKHKERMLEISLQNKELSYEDNVQKSKDHRW
jgi:hypothetical protein